MNEFIFDDAISCLDSDLIDDHLKKKGINRLPKKSKKFSWIKRSLAIAACLCLISMTCVVCFNLLNNDTPETIDYLDRSYKDFSITIDEQNVVWPWEYKLIYEKWESIDINGVKYVGSKNECDASMIGESIGSFAATGYDHTLDYDNNGYRASFNVFEIKDVSSQRLVAVELEGKYYVYASVKYSMPNTLDDVFKEYGLASTIELSSYSKQYLDEKKQYFKINDDSYIWDALTKCKDATPINDIIEILQWYEVERNSIDFILNSDALGVENKSFKITDDGYIWSDAFYGEFIYYIGAETAQDIISYIAKHSIAIDEKAKEKLIIGTIIDITDEHILIEDSLLCKNPEDAITIKIMLEDVRIARYIELDVIGVGDTVQIIYDDKIIVDDIYIVDSAVSINKVFIDEKNIIIPE